MDDKKEILFKEHSAYPTIFGFCFQKNGAILLFLENIKLAKSMKVESCKQDIEILLNDGNHIYAQAKSLVKYEREKFLDECKQKKMQVAVLDVPLLIECGWHKNVDQVWLVAVKRRQQIERAMIRSGMTEAEVCVLSTDINEFRNGTYPEFADMSFSEKMKRFAPDKTVKLARERIGEQGYNIIHNNCEHFAYECVFGKKYSSQEEKVRALIKSTATGKNN